MEFVAELLHKNLLRNFFVILSLLQFFAVQKKRNLLQNFSVVLSLLQQSFFRRLQNFCFVLECGIAAISFVLSGEETLLQNFVLF